MPPRRKQFFSFAKEDKISALLDKENVTVAEVLDQDTLSASIIENSSDKLFNYLNQPKNIEELIKWSLTTEYSSNQNYVKLSNAAVNVFTNCSKKFAQMLSENQTFSDKIVQFISSKQQNPRCCGNFFKITESMANCTNGEFLKNLPNLSEFLIDNFSIFPLKDLFVSMCSSYPEEFGFDLQLLIKIASKIDDDNCLFVISAFREIVNGISDAKFTYFESVELIDILFKFAIEYSDKEPLFAVEIFRFLKDLNDLESFETARLKFIEKFEYKFNLSLPFQISVFEVLNSKIFDIFFDPHSCSLLTEAIYKVFYKKSEEERHAYTKSDNLCQKILENFSKSSMNSRIADMAVIINYDLQNLNDIDQSFSEFVTKDVTEHINLRDELYGGKIFDSDYDEINEEEEKVVDFSENKEDEKLNKSEQENET